MATEQVRAVVDALNIVVTFGDMLKFLRRRARLTQRQLGLAVGYSEAQICRLEQNQRLPDPITLAALFVPALGLEHNPQLATRLLELAAQARGGQKASSSQKPEPEPEPHDGNADWLRERLAEALSQAMALTGGMRVLDLGCGRAASSVFLAREFGVQVWAGDARVEPAGNWRRVRDAGLGALVYPMRLEAQALPFPDGFFDAVVSVSVGADRHFDADDRDLGDLARLLRPGGQLGIVVPGVGGEVDGVVPPQLQPCGDPEYRWLHSPRWWARHLARSGLVEVDLADMVPDGWLHWLRWERRAPLAEVLARDAGRTLGFTRVVARRSRSRGPRSGADGRMLGGETVSWADFVH